jgi:hypothetical protein
MRFKLPRQVTNAELNKLISREIKRQEILIPKASNKTLQEIAKVCREIEEKGFPDHLICKKLPKSLGHGMFLHPKAKPIEKGTVIAPYSGQLSLEAQNDPEDSDYAFAPLSEILLCAKEEQTLFDPSRRYHPRRYYVLSLDAQNIGNFTRFINHSEKPNIEAHFLRIPKNSFNLSPGPLDVIYMAKKKVLPGEQLLVSYEDGEEDSYWGPLGITPYPLFPNTFHLTEDMKVV